jgi:hypothetical protein
MEQVSAALLPVMQMFCQTLGCSCQPGGLKSSATLAKSQYHGWGWFFVEWVNVSAGVFQLRD